MRDQARRIGLHLVLLDVAADGVGAGHARHGLHLRPDDPVLDVRRYTARSKSSVRRSPSGVR